MSSLSCVAGVYIGRYVNAVLIAVIIGLLIFFISSHRSLLWHFGIAMVIFAVGNYRGVSQNSGFDELRRHFETKITVVANSLEDAEYDDRGQLAFSASNITIDGLELPGQLAISGFGETSVLRGDQVEVTGKLFPARGSNQARISFAKLDVLNKDDLWHNSLRRKLNKKLRDNLPEPQSSFASGLLIGQRSTIPDEIITSLRVTGLAHIIAVSGYNLTIIIRSVMKLLKRFSRYQKFVVAGSTIIGFLLITGFSASIVRASIVCGLSLLAWYYGRNFRPAVLLGITAAGTVIYKPEYVWGDAGWYLSFLAFAGILIASPIIQYKLYGEKKPKLVGRLFVETCAVLLLVTPYSLYLFGSFSFIALPANILVVPLIPLAMAFSAICIIAPYWLPIIAKPAEYLLSVILEISKQLATIPFASANIRITLIETVSAYAFIIIILYMMWNKRRISLMTNVLIQ